MTTLPFPTGKDALLPGHGAAARTGFPTAARPCRCAHTCVNEDTCLWCGRLPLEAVRASWALRALVLERAATRRLELVG